MAQRIGTMLTKGLIAATLIGPLAGSAIAQTQTEPNRPGTVAVDRGMDRGTTAPVDRRDDGFNWGLLGLVGLAGLAGLTRRNDVKDHVRSDHTDRVGAARA